MSTAVSHSTEFEGFVLAGGASTRMGRDKAMIEVAGRPLLHRSVEALAAARRVRVVGGPYDGIDLGVEWVPDVVDGHGPLVGLLSAMTVSENDVMVVLSCDLPAMSTNAVHTMIGALGDGDVVIPVIHGRMQWVTAAWHIRCRPQLAAAFARGERSIKGAVGSLRIVYLLDRPEEYRDVDTPEDLELLVPSRGAWGPAVT